ncbi:MAG: peptidoglycan-binding protein [Gammaproteobacteria bacterium]
MHGRSRSPTLFIFAAAVFMLLASSIPAAAATHTGELRNAIRAQANQLDARGGLYVQGLAIASGRLLPDFYAARDYAPIWTSSTRVDELFALLGTAESHGLDSRDYYLPQLQQMRERYRESQLSVEGRESSARLGAALDMLLTESLIRFGYHQRYGKVNPQAMEPTWNFTRRLPAGKQPLTMLQEVVVAPSLSGILLGWVAKAPFYRRLQDKLAEFREIAAAGGWPITAAGATLREGDHDARIPVIRRRLMVTGQLSQSVVPDSELFDADLVAGVRNFQAAYGLDADGIIGQRTISEMNVPVATRIDQLRLSLERARWVTDHPIPSARSLVRTTL